MIEGQFIGLDVGGTKIASATLQDGKLTTRDLVKTDVSDGDALVAQLLELIEDLREEHAVAVGVGLPSIIEFETGRIAHSVNIPLQDVPLPGTLEYLAAGRALDRLAQREAREEEDSFLGKRLADDGEVTGHDVVDGAKAGDADALRVLDILGQRLGIGIANAINLFDPMEIVVG